MWHSWTAADGKLLANNGGSSVRWNLLDAVAVDGNNVMPIADSNIHLQMTGNQEHSRRNADRQLRGWQIGERRAPKYTSTSPGQLR